MASRRICTANGHVYNLAVEPAAGRPASATSTARRSSSAPTTSEETVRARMAEQIPPLLEVVDHYRDAGVLQPVDGRAADRRRSATASWPAASARRRRRRRRADGHPQVAPRDREDARRRADRRRGPRPRRVRAQARRHDRPPRPARRAPHPPPGAMPSFKGYGHRSNPFPASLCISIDDEVVHGIPGDRLIRDGQIVSIDAGAIYDGWHGDGARTFVVGEPPPEVAELVDTTRLAMMAGIAAAVPGRRTSATSRRRSRTSPRPAATASSASSSATGSAPRCTRSRRSRTTGPASAGMKLVPGICLAIEPMLTLGSHEVAVRPDGWTVVTARRLAGRPLRAHDRGHRKRPRDPDDGLT